MRSLRGEALRRKQPSARILHALTSLCFFKCVAILYYFIFHIAMSEEKGKAKERETAKERAKKRMVKKLPYLSPRPSSHSDPHCLLRQSIHHVEN